MILNFNSKENEESMLKVSEQQNKEKIQREILLIRKSLDSLKSEVQQSNNALVHAQKIYSVADEVYQKSKDSLSINDRFFYLIGGLVVGLIGLFVTLTELTFQRFKKRSEKRIELYINRSENNLSNYESNLEKKISKQINENAVTLKNMIKKHLRESELLENTKILIINRKNTSIETSFSIVLNKFHRPTIIDSIDLHEIDESSIKNYDVIILDNTREKSDKETNIWDFSEDSLRKRLISIIKIASANESAFLFFGEKDGKIKDDQDVKEIAHLLSFSNQPATLFANLLNLIDFRKIYKEQK